MGGETKVTKMLIKVDLQCCKCYKKIKKVLCSFPQIRDQVFDDKTNTVLITVLCCSPEKIRDKICCKGKDAIIAIDIIPDKPKEPEKPKAPEKPKEPEKPKAPEKPKEPEKPKAPEKPKEPEKPKAPEKPKEPEKPKQPEKPKEPEKPKVTIVEPPKEAPKPKPAEPPKEPPKPKAAAEPPKEAPKPPPAQPPAPAPKEPEQCFPAAGYPPPVYMGGMCCCQPYYDGYGRGGPCYCQTGYGIPAPPPMCFDGCGRPAYECQGGNRGYYGGGRCGDYFSEENASGCSIM